MEMVERRKPKIKGSIGDGAEDLTTAVRFIANLWSQINLRPNRWRKCNDDA